MSTSKMSQIVRSAADKMDIAHHASVQPLQAIGKTASGDYIVQDQIAVMHSSLKVPLNIKWQSANAVPTNLFSNSGASVDIKIDPSFPAKLHDLELEIKVSESGGTNSVTLVPAPLMIDRVELVFNGETIQTIYGDCLQFNTAVLHNAQLASVAAIGGYNTSYQATGTVIAANGSTTYFVPLFGNLFAQMRGLYLPNLRDVNILLRVYGRNSITAGTGSLRCDNIFLHGKCHHLSPASEAAELAKDRDQVINYNFVNVVRFENPYTFAAGNATTVQLNQFDGDCAQLIGGLRANPGTASGYNNWADLRNDGLINMLDSNGQNIVGGSPLNYGQVRYLDWPRQFPGSLNQTFPLVWQPFGDPVKAIQHGIRDGFQYLDSKDQIQLTPGAGFVAGTYTLTLYGYIWGRFQMKEGKFWFYKK